MQNLLILDVDFLRYLNGPGALGCLFLAQMAGDSAMDSKHQFQFVLQVDNLSFVWGPT